VRLEMTIGIISNKKSRPKTTFLCAYRKSGRLGYKP
jgi:hypothetical protein